MIKYTVRGLVEAEKFLADLASGSRELGGASVLIGTPLPRGLFTDVGTRRGTRATHWLSGVANQAGTLAREAVAAKVDTPLQMAEGLKDAGEKVAAMTRPPVATGQLRGSIRVMFRRGMPGGRLHR